ncbi:MAG: hypothetical protein Q7S92_06315 [Candidatus Diapherotrites archaeon]|nr:hypothetical protein [Candidatus Diapherotrites archaeon]
MKQVKVYIAGKISPDSIFKTEHWREQFCQQLELLSKTKIVNLYSAKTQPFGNLNESNPYFIVGLDTHLLKQADLVIVNLTDDISVGASQEMLIAKYFKKPLIGLAPKGGRFVKEQKQIWGNTYENWTHPFVALSCDLIVHNLDDLAEAVQKFARREILQVNIKTLSYLDEVSKIYEDEFLELEKSIQK